MNIEQAEKIVSSLANGTHPITGIDFPNNSPYNHRSIKSALFVMLDLVSDMNTQRTASIEEKQTQNLKSGNPKNSNLRWPEDQRQEVAKMFYHQKSIEFLAEKYGRTEIAICSELYRQKLVPKDYWKKYSSTT